MRIPPKTEARIMTVGMALSMSGIISFVMTLVNFGARHGFAAVWMKAWGVGLLCALPLSAVVPKILKRIIIRINNL